MKKHPLRELDDIHASQQLKQKTLQNVMHKSKNRKSWGVSLGVLTITCMCFLFFIYQGNITQPDPLVKDASVAYSYVSFDINPSLELHLNKEQKVIEIKTFNDDAKDLLTNYIYKDKDAQTVLKEIVSLPNFQPYLEEGFLQISVFSNDEDTSASLEKNVDETLALILNKNQYNCTCASKQDKEIADQHHMSFGKYQIINEIINKDSTYRLEDLQDYSMYDLKSIYESLFQKQYQENSHKGNPGNKHGQNHK